MDPHQEARTNPRFLGASTEGAKLLGSESFGKGASSQSLRFYADEYRAAHPREGYRFERELLKYPIFSTLDSARSRYVIPSSVKAIALDFDGTTMKLSFTEGNRQEAYRRVIHAYGLQVLGRRLSRDEERWCHKPAVQKCEVEMSKIIAGNLSALLNQPIDPVEVWTRWTETCNRLVQTHEARHGRPARTAFVKGIVPFVVEAARRGVPVSICTAGAYPLVEPLLRVGGLLEHLHVEGNVYVHLHPQIRSKPHPDPYLLVCEKVNVRPEELLVAEDSATGVLAALRAGAKVLLQPSGHRPSTLHTLIQRLEDQHPEWLHELPGAITVLSPNRGWCQLAWPD